MRALALLALSAAVSASVPMPPILCGSDPKIVTVIEDAPAIDRGSNVKDEPLPTDLNADQPGRVIRADGKAVYTFLDFGETPTECVLETYPAVEEDPANFLPAPAVEPGYDEHDPIGPTDDGKPGAGTVDKPPA